MNTGPALLSHPTTPAGETVHHRQEQAAAGAPVHSKLRMVGNGYHLSSILATGGNASAPVACSLIGAPAGASVNEGPFMVSLELTA